MSDQTAPDAPVVDDLDVEAALAVLGIDASILDRELDEAEKTVLPVGLWEPAPGLEERVEAGVAQRLRDREAAWMLADLVGLGWSTLKAVIDDERGDSK